MDWYSVRCVFRDTDDPRLFEERVTLWQTGSFDQAIERAEAEAEEYASDLTLRYLHLAQAYKLAEEPSEGGEVFSLIRESALDERAYLDAFFDSGTERLRRT